MNPTWKNSNKTYIWIFNCGRGLSICARLPNNQGIIYDLGCSEDFSPLSFIEKEIMPYLDYYDDFKKPGQIILSHPHTDHIQEVERLHESDVLNPGLITLPHDKDIDDQIDELVDFSRIMRDDNKEIIEKYRRLYKKRNPPLQTLQSDKCSSTNENVSYGIFYMRPPEISKIYQEDDQKYVNGLSICLYLRHNRHSIWIPGDITPEIHENVIEGSESIEKRFSYFSEPPEDYPDDYYEKTSVQPNPSELFQEHGLTAIVAPHHGLESCFFQGLYDSIPGEKPLLNIVSEKRHTSETEGVVDDRYSDEKHSLGTYVDIEGSSYSKRLISTRSGHHICIIFGRDSLRPKIFLRKNPDDLLNLS